MIQLLANEVVGLGFEYFDGTEWPTDWDSDAMGGLPRAIRVWLSIKPTYGMSEQEMAQAATGKAPVETDFYFVISLPTAPLVATSTTETTDAAQPPAALIRPPQRLRRGRRHETKSRSRLPSRTIAERTRFHRAGPFRQTGPTRRGLVLVLVLIVIAMLSLGRLFLHEPHAGPS